MTGSPVSSNCVGAKTCPELPVQRQLCKGTASSDRHHFMQKHPQENYKKGQQWCFSKLSVTKVFSCIFNLQEKVNNRPSIISVRANDAVPLPPGPHKLTISLPITLLKSFKKTKQDKKLLPSLKSRQILVFLLFPFPSSGKRGGRKLMDCLLFRTEEHTKTQRVYTKRYLNLALLNYINAEASMN